MTSSYSYFFSSDPKNGAIHLDDTGSRFVVNLTQPISFPKNAKNIDLLLNSASIWYTTVNVSKTLYDNATFVFTLDSDTISVDLEDGLYSLQDVYDQLSLLSDLQLPGIVFEKLFTFTSFFSVQKVAVQFLQNNLQINWGLSTVRKLLGFDANQDAWPGQSSGTPINNILNKSIIANNVGNFSALTSYLIHSSLIGNGLSVNGVYKNVIGEVPITVDPGELLNHKALAPAIAFNANELIGTSWSSLNFWISSQTDTILDMNGEYWSFSITAMVTY
jgi:hypothetical protein